MSLSKRLFGYSSNCFQSLLFRLGSIYNFFSTNIIVFLRQVSLNHTCHRQHVVGKHFQVAILPSFLSLSLTASQNKLERFSLASFFSLSYMC